MKKVWKYAIQNITTLSLPKGAAVLSVGFKGQNLFLWVLVEETEVIKEDRKFQTFKTNDPIEHNLDQLKYIGSCGIVDNTMFFHTFEMLIR